jgi:hypothetical protein
LAQNCLATMLFDKPPNAMRLFWSGPHAWPGFESQNGLTPLPKHSGVYLLTFPYQDGFLIYAAGVTRRLYRKRFTEHKREYLRGAYNVLDPVQARSGVRSKIWRGWGYWRAHGDEFAARRNEIQAAVTRQLAAFCVFVADIQSQGRTPERLEAAIMEGLYAAQPPLCDVPDKGMFLAPRLSREEPITVLNACASKLYGLPERLPI